MHENKLLTGEEAEKIYDFANDINLKNFLIDSEFQSVIHLINDDDFITEAKRPYLADIIAHKLNFQYHFFSELGQLAIRAEDVVVRPGKIPMTSDLDYGQIIYSDYIEGTVDSFKPAAYRMIEHDRAIDRHTIMMVLIAKNGIVNYHMQNQQRTVQYSEAVEFNIDLATASDNSLRVIGLGESRQ